MTTQTKTRGKTTRKSANVFTKEERAAIQEYVREKTRTGNKPQDEDSVVKKIDGMKEPDRTLGKRLHNIMKTNAPNLAPRLWYGMPAYANKDGKIVCFFQDAAKFKSRYATLGFSDKANLDEGNLWPVVYALKQLTSTEEARIIALLKKALG